MRKFDPKQFKKKIESQFGSVSQLKSYLQNEAEDLGWDCKLSEVEIDGVKVKYTDNPNHFATFFIQLQHVGMTGTYALDYSSYTPAGKRRGAANFKPIIL